MTSDLSKPQRFELGSRVLGSLGSLGCLIWALRQLVPYQQTRTLATRPRQLLPYHFKRQLVHGTIRPQKPSRK